MIIKNCPQKSWLSAWKEIVPRGEIVIRNVRKSSWCLSENQSIEVSCQCSDCKVLPDLLVPFLTAIPDPGVRYDLFMNNLNVLSRAVNLSIGDEVNVLVEIDKAKIALKAVIRYKGNLPEMKGHYFGVELLVSAFVYISTVKLQYISKFSDLNFYIILLCIYCISTF